MSCLKMASGCGFASPLQPTARRTSYAVARCGSTQLAPCKRGRLYSRGSLLHGRNVEEKKFAIRCAGDEEAAAEEEDAPVADAAALKLAESAGPLKNISYVSFWVQLGLSLASLGILVFSVGQTFLNTGSVGPTYYFTMVGVATSLLSTFFAHGFYRLAKQITKGNLMGPQRIAKAIFANQYCNLAGLACTVIGLQAISGILVAKTLTQATVNAYQAAARPNNLAAFDIFSVQACANTLLAHLVSMLFLSVLQRIVNKSVMLVNTEAAPA